MKTDLHDAKESVLSGLGVSAGVAIGPAYVIETGATQVPEYTIAASAMDAECQRFADAAAKARRQIKKLKAKALLLPEAAAEEVGFLLDAHMAMVSGSRLTRGVERRIRQDLINAEAATQAEIAAIAHSFQGMADAYLAARIADVREVGARLIRNLTEHEYQAFSMLPQGVIIIAEELSPAETALLDPGIVAGFASVQGGAEGHTAIMARSLGIPAVLAVHGLLAEPRNGDVVIVDGEHGKVILRPTLATLAEYRARQTTLQHEREQLKGLRLLPSITADGTTLALFANIELPREISAALEAGASGIGLFRTEFMFMNRDTLPDEDEQYEALRTVVEGMGGRTVTARTLDLGSDKLAEALDNRFNESDNPALGLRAVRLSQREPKLLEVQLAAMLRASTHGPLRILLPLITTVSEIHWVRDMLATVAKRLKRRGVKIGESLPALGAMIEVPGAALTADALAACSDFLAIGTNDLTQYTLAIDRGDDQVAHLYDPLHPAVLRLIQFTAQAAMRARIPISVCGEIAGDPRFTALLAGLGIHELSMTPNKLPLVKRRIRTLDLRSASRRAQTIMDQSDSARIAELLDEFNAAG
ncbi:MAG: phosphoenolpyruvate--protein phosphotransferase [Rhodospirillaceae bacterium]